MIEVNYLIIVVCAVLSMVVGFIWFGPLFQKKWYWIIDVDPNDEAAVAKTKEGMGKLFLVDIALTLFQVYVLYHYIKGAEDEMSAMSNSLWIWAGFVVVTLASDSIWSGRSRDKAWAKFFIQAGYMLVMFVIYAFVISTWG